MPKCKHCGTEVQPEDVFCVNCGNTISGAHKIEFKDKPREEKATFKGIEMEEMPEVYHSNSRTYKAKAILFGIVAIVSILLILMVVGLVKELKNPAHSELSNCPYECCLLEEESTFLEKKCTNEFASCIDNKCILEDCPFECCDTLEFQPKECTKDKQYCLNNTCYKEDCPFECCLDNEGFATKKCVNNGSCVNNNCLLKPCPSDIECCMDDLEYEDKPCSPGNMCVDRECKIGIIEIIKRYVNGIFNIFKLIL